MVSFTLMALEVGEHKLSFTLHTNLGSETLIKTLHVVVTIPTITVTITATATITMADMKQKQSAQWLPFF